MPWVGVNNRDAAILTYKRKKIFQSGEYVYKYFDLKKINLSVIRISNLKFPRNLEGATRWLGPWEIFTKDEERNFYEGKRKKAYTWLLGVSTSEPKTYYFGILGIIYKGKLVTL